jgi:hypothetical protein
LLHHHGATRIRWPPAGDLQPEPRVPDALESIHQRSLPQRGDEDPLVARRHLWRRHNLRWRYAQRRRDDRGLWRSRRRCGLWRSRQIPDDDHHDAVEGHPRFRSWLLVHDHGEQRLGRPAVTSNQAIFWHALRLLGQDDRIAGLGQLFQLGVPVPA